MYTVEVSGNRNFFIPIALKGDFFITFLFLKINAGSECAVLFRQYSTGCC